MKKYTESIYLPLEIRTKPLPKKIVVTSTPMSRTESWVYRFFNSTSQKEQE